MEERLLREPGIFPTEPVISAALGRSYAAWQALLKALKTVHGLDLEWKYFKDGNSWLAKIAVGSKTICWVSVWKGYFKTGFYFTAKHVEAVQSSGVDDALLRGFGSTTIGKLIPLTIIVKNKKQVAEVMKVVALKKGLK